MNHRRAKNDCASIQELFGGKLRPSVCIAVGVCLARAEINKARGLGRREDLFCQADVDVEVALLGGDFLEVVRLSCKMNDGINYRQLIELIPGVERSIRYTIPLGGRDVEREALMPLLCQLLAEAGADKSVCACDYDFHLQASYKSCRVCQSIGTPIP